MSSSFRGVPFGFGVSNTSHPLNPISVFPVGSEKEMYPVESDWKPSTNADVARWRGVAFDAFTHLLAGDDCAD